MRFYVGKKIKKEFPNYFNVEGKKISDKQNIANEFNNYFVGIGPRLSNKISSSSNINFENYLIKDIDSTFNFQTVNEENVSDIISKLIPKSSSGHDQLSSNLIKSMSNSICPILTHMINQSLLTGIFPDESKNCEGSTLHRKVR